MPAPALSAAAVICSLTSCGGAPRHLLCLTLDLRHRQIGEILPGELRGAQVFRADVIGRCGACIPGFTLAAGLGEVAVTEQGLIEIEMIGTHLAHRLGFAARDIGADTERHMAGGDAASVAGCATTSSAITLAVTKKPNPRLFDVP